MKTVRNRALVFVVVILLSRSGFAEHPQLMLDAAELSFMRAKVAQHAADWRALKQDCDALSSFAVEWPDPVTGGTSRRRGLVSGSGQASAVINTGYNGNRFNMAITELGVCYQALKPDAGAAKYLAQAHNIIRTISQPPLKLTRDGDGATRYAASVDLRGNDLRAGDRVSVYMPYSIVRPGGDPKYSLNIGEVWTITGATGCTSLNGTWRVFAKEGNIIFFSNPDGSVAPPLNADCTLYSFEAIRDTGYPLRNWIPALAEAYDWFYDGLTPEEKDHLRFCMNAWTHEFVVTGLHSLHPENNYTFGAFWALVAAYVATDGDNSGEKLFYEESITNRLLGLHQIRDYRRLWMAGGGFGEGWQAYGFNATRWMMNAVLAMKIHGTDWTQPPYDFNFVNDTLRYWMEFTSPTKLALDDNEFVYPIGATAKGVTEPLWIPLGDAAMFTATARRFHSTLAPQFQSWYREVDFKLRAAAGKSVPAWDNGVYPSRPNLVDEFLYYDPHAESADWKTLPLMYRAWSGNYAVSRSDWTDNGIEVTLLGGPTVGSAGNGKTQFNSGSVTVQRGSAHLVVYGLGEAARSGDIVTGRATDILQGERASYGNKKNSVFWAAPNPSETRSQGLGSRTPPPGQSSEVTSWGSSIDRAEDVDSYTYWRATGLEANNARSVTDHKFHQTTWTREVFFLRPKLVIVHDHTEVINSEDDRAMFWTFGRMIQSQPAAPGMMRYDATFRGEYRGAFTSVLPASPSTVSVVDHDDMHFLYRVEVRPAAMDHKEDNWLAILDAADSPKKVTAVVALKAANADAVQFSDASQTVIAFSQAKPISLPIRVSVGQFTDAYVAGLNPSTNYKVSVDSTSFTIAADDGTERRMSTEAGVLRIHHP
jgi:hypothetical protein